MKLEFGKKKYPQRADFKVTTFSFMQSEDEPSFGMHVHLRKGRGERSKVWALMSFKQKWEWEVGQTEEEDSMGQGRVKIQEEEWRSKKGFELEVPSLNRSEEKYGDMLMRRGKLRQLVSQKESNIPGE